jgi:uncharacterized protein (DUF2252 family)
MAAAASSRVWASLTDDEAEEVARASKAQDMRPSELARMALLSYIRQPPATGQAPGVAPPAMARLETLTETLGRHVEALARVVPVMEDAYAEQDAVRASLRDIAVAVGTLAASIEPPDEVEGAFGRLTG